MGRHRLGLEQNLLRHLGRRLILGFMIVCAGLSMWMTNTSTTMMLLPIAYITFFMMMNSSSS